MFPFQRRSGPQFRDFSSKMLPFQIRYGPLEKATRTILKPAFWHFRVTFPPRFEGGRVGRAVSAVCFFVLILNNAPALRAGNEVRLQNSTSPARRTPISFISPSVFSSLQLEQRKIASGKRSAILLRYLKRNLYCRTLL